MTQNKARTELEQELITAFIEQKAVDFEAVGSIIAKYGARAALTGTSLVTIINKNLLINCGWPGPEITRGFGQRTSETGD